MSVRLRRLQSDYEAVRRLARFHPRIEVEGVSGNPPEKYRLLLKVRSLREKAGQVIVTRKHRLEVTLPLGYPRDAPLCRMLTPVFHPNIAPHAVCIGDHWSAAESLDRMIQRVGEMLAFQSYNVKSPLNGRAAQWVEENVARLPLETDELFVDLDASPAATADPELMACANCSTTEGTFDRCGAGHALCGDCGMRCEHCDRTLCLVCGTARCPACVGGDCANCGARAMPGEGHLCEKNHILCRHCAVSCDECGRPLCLVCGEYPCAACRAAAV